MHFATVGAYILTLSVIVGGLLLCTDYVLLRITALVVGKPAKGLSRGVVRVAKTVSTMTEPLTRAGNRNPARVNIGTPAWRNPTSCCN